MKIEIVTKFNIGDEVIGYVRKRGFRKYRVDDIRVQTHSVEYTGEDIEYRCTMITDGNLTCQETFTQAELFSADGLRDCVNKFLTFPTTTKQAKHDLDMYRAIVDALPSANCNYMVYNTTYWDCRKWLENKFPELEQFININKNNR